MAQTADFHKSEMLNYFTSKFGRFITNEMMRNIIGQTKSAFDFRKVMDESKILLINLSKGLIGEVNSNLLGMITVAKLQMAAMSRADIPEDQRKDFYLYVDEFQNFATENFIYILSEARKYRLNLALTNQYVAQLDEKIRDAVFGNVGTLISFRIGASDAEFIEKEYAPVFTSDDLINIDKYHAYIKLLIDGVASKPFSMLTIKDETGQDINKGEAIKQLSRLKYGRDKGLVEHEIFQRAKIQT
jgi:superfamily II DNA or RNA helicase